MLLMASSALIKIIQDEITAVKSGAKTWRESRPSWESKPHPENPNNYYDRLANSLADMVRVTRTHMETRRGNQSYMDNAYQACIAIYRAADRVFQASVQGYDLERNFQQLRILRKHT